MFYKQQQQQKAFGTEVIEAHGVITLEGKIESVAICVK